MVPSFLSHLDRCKPDVQRQLGLGNSNKQAVSLWVSKFLFFLFFLSFSLLPLRGSACKKQAVPLRCSSSASARFIYFRWSFGIGENEKDTFLKAVFNFFKGEAEEELSLKILPRCVQFCAKCTACFCVCGISGGWVGRVYVTVCYETRKSCRLLMLTHIWSHLCFLFDLHWQKKRCNCLFNVISVPCRKVWSQSRQQLCRPWRWPVCLEQRTQMPQVNRQLFSSLHEQLSSLVPLCTPPGHACMEMLKPSALCVRVWLGLEDGAWPQTGQLGTKLLVFGQQHSVTLTVWWMCGWL